MIRPINLKGVAADDLWLISDLHWNHDKLVTARGYSTPDEHNAALITAWNSVCAETSTVVHLGDLIFKTDEDGFWSLIRQLRFKRLYLLWGNHLSGQKQAYRTELCRQFPNAFDETGQNPDHYEVYPLHSAVDGNWERTVTFLPEYVELSVAGKQHIVCCHYPLIVHNGMSHGNGPPVLHCCGHSHGSLPLTNRDTGQGMRLDVGFESFGRPVSLTEIRTHLAGRDLDIRDHHQSS